MENGAWGQEGRQEPTGSFPSFPLDEAKAQGVRDKSTFSWHFEHWPNPCSLLSLFFWDGFQVWRSPGYGKRLCVGGVERNSRTDAVRKEGVRTNSPVTSSGHRDWPRVEVSSELKLCLSPPEPPGCNTLSWCRWNTLVK